MKKEYLYIKRETEKALLLITPSESFWIPKSIVDRHEKYPFLAKPYSFFEANNPDQFKRWKRDIYEPLHIMYMAKNKCRYCHTVDEEWVDDKYDIDYEKPAYCSKCGWRIRNEDRNFVVDILSDSADLLGNIRAHNFVKEKLIKDPDLFFNCYIVNEGQMRMLDQDMKEVGGYYEDGMHCEAFVF